MTHPRNNDLATGLAIVAGAVIAAFSIGSTLYELSKASDSPRSRRKPRAMPKKTEEAPKPSAAVADAIRDLSSGRKEEHSLIDFMLVRYHALAVLGQQGHVLKGDELDSLSRELGHLHRQCYDHGRLDGDRALTEWYSTSGQSRTLPFTKMLLSSEVGAQLKNAEINIARALGAIL